MDDNNGSGCGCILLFVIVALIAAALFGFDRYVDNKVDEIRGGNNNYYVLEKGIFVPHYLDYKWDCDKSENNNVFKVECTNVDGTTLVKYTDTFQYVIVP